MEEQKIKEAIKRIRKMQKDKILKIRCLVGKFAEQCDYNNDVEACNTAIEALEKQLPKKPIERHYEEEGEEPYIKMTCPNGCRF